jgi:hypothetical protein
MYTAKKTAWPVAHILLWTHTFDHFLSQLGQKSPNEARKEQSFYKLPFFSQSPVITCDAYVPELVGQHGDPVLILRHVYFLAQDADVIGEKIEGI